MPRDIIMPALGMAQETGTVVRWLKAEGEAVKQGEPLAEIMTDKATVELEAPADGTLAQVSASEGAEVPVGHTIARIALAGEGAPIAAQMEPRGQSATVAVATARDGAASMPRLRAASPKARRIAAEQGIVLGSVSGTGPRGVVLAADVLAAAQAVVAEAPARPPRIGAGNGSQGAPVSSAWRLMAQRTTRSWQEAPQFFVAREVNASQMVAWRSQARKQITYTDLLVKLVAAALRDHPRLNSSWNSESIVTHADINIGVAVATEDGLVAPVIARADQMSLAQIAQRRAELVERARAGRLRPDDLSGGTFTVSNLGMYGVDAFSAILVPPQAGILAVGRVADRVVPLHGIPAVQPMMWLQLTCDHRVVDGARGAQFLGALAELIETPLLLLG